MNAKEKKAYRKGQLDLIKGTLGFMALVATFATMFGQAFLF